MLSPTTSVRSQHTSSAYSQYCSFPGVNKEKSSAGRKQRNNTAAQKAASPKSEDWQALQNATDTQICEVQEAGIVPEVWPSQTLQIVHPLWDV